MENLKENFELFKMFLTLMKENAAPAESAVVAKSKNLASRNHGKYCIIRTYSAGAHVGILVDSDYDTVVLKESRRIHYWAQGEAASLSQMAVDGLVKGSSDTRIAIQLDDEIVLNGAIEILPCTAKAERSLRGAATWKM